MAFLDALNNIPTYIGLDTVTKAVGDWLDKHPTINKIVIIAIHIFRIIGMIALTFLLPFSPIINFAIGLGAALFYRITVERFCPFRFSIMSALGCGAFELSKSALNAIISGIAFQSFSSFAVALAGCVPIITCAVAVVWVAVTSVDEKYNRSNQGETAGSCCGQPPKAPEPTCCSVQAPKKLITASCGTSSCCGG